MLHRRARVLPSPPRTDRVCDAGQSVVAVVSTKVTTSANKFFTAAPCYAVARFCIPSRSSFVHAAMINDFEAWSAPRAERNPFSALDGAVLAIEATFYLERLLTSRPSKEPLLAALGGAPFALRTHIENELEILKSANISPVFVFKGLEVGKAYDPFAASNDAVGANVKAWELYDAHQPEPAVDTFGNSGMFVKLSARDTLLISI